MRGQLNHESAAPNMHSIPRRWGPRRIRAVHRWKHREERDVKIQIVVKAMAED